MKIVSIQIEIRLKKMLAKFIENNFYIFDTISFQFLLFSLREINPETLKLW